MATELLTFREGNISPTEIGTQYTLQMLKELADAKPGMIGNCSLFRNETSPNGSISGPGTGKFQSSELQKRSKSNFSNMTTIKLEQEILVLKARVEDSDQEILRLSDKIKRYQNQLSDVSDQMVNLQSERDYYRLKLVEMHVPEDGSDKQALTDTIGTYIREIDSLKVLIAKYKLELTQREVFPRESYFSIEETQESDIELSGELSSVAHVIASSEEQLLKEKKLLEKLENGDESGDSESDIQSQIDNHDNMAEKDRVFQKRQKIMTAEVNELSESIQLKEQLVIQLQRSQKQYEIMQRFYEEKLMALCNEMQTKEDEKRRLELELQELSLLKEVEAIKTDREDELKVLLQEKENELHKLRKRQQELSHLSHIQSRSSDQLRKLQQDIVTMKKQRVDLAKKLQSEKKMHLIALNNKAKEIDKLKRDLTRAMAKVQQLGKEKQQVELKFRVTVKDKEIPQKKKRVSEQGSPQDSSPNRSTSRDSRRWGKNTNYLSSNRPLSEEEVRTKKWLDKHVKVIAERETAAEELRLQYEQQLFLAHQKKQLEDVREPIRSLIMQGKRESSDQRGDVLLSAEEEEVLVDVEEKINRLEGQLKYRNEEIDRIEKKLKGGKSSHDKTIEILQQSAAKNLPAAHQLIRLLFDMLVSTRKIARMNKENMDLLRSRETKLTEELEEAQSRLTTIVRIHDKEIARIERDYEEKLAGLFNHTQLSQILTGDNRESNGLLPKDSFEDFDHPSLRPRYIRTSISTSGEDISQGDDRYKTLAALSHERLVAVKSHLMREEARCRELERTIDDYLIERKELKEQYELKIRENKFLDDECRMLRDMVQDLKAKLNLENVMQKKNLSALRANDEDSDSSYDDSVILDSAVLGELSSLGDEISRTGSVKFIDQKGQNDIFERLANPSNFTGTQKTIFEGDLETNRAKVQQIKEGSLANKKKRGDNKPISTNPLLIEEFENGENEEFPQTPKEDALYQSELEVEASHSTRDDFMESRLNSTPRRATFDPLQSPDNVFSRLLNPSKFTGIHRRRTDNLDLPHSSHGFSSNDVKNRRSVKSGGSSSGNTSSPPGKSTSTDDFQLSMSEYEVPNRKQVERPRSEHNVFTRLQRKVSDGIAKTKGSKSAANK